MYQGLYLRFEYLRYFFIACNDGTFGHGCINNCSGQCVDDSVCNKQTGQCDMGCNPGYKNTFCNESTYTEIENILLVIYHAFLFSVESHKKCIGHKT